MYENNIMSFRDDLNRKMCSTQALPRREGTALLSASSWRAMPGAHRCERELTEKITAEGRSLGLSLVSQSWDGGRGEKSKNLVVRNEHCRCVLSKMMEWQHSSTAQSSLLL